MKSIPPPPNTYHGLLALALKDYDIIVQNPFYDIDMGYWHKPTIYLNGHQRCMVCLAGCVMSATHNIPFMDSASPDEFSDEWERAFNSLNILRQGGIGPNIVYPVPYWGNNLPQWRQAMQHFLEYLQLQNI